MKKIIILIFINILSVNAQTFPLRTYTEIPANGYLKDTNNELNAYIGTWQGSWNGKKIEITFKKITNKYNNNLKYYKDYLIAKFKVITTNNSVLFDNTSFSDNDAKIMGGKFRKTDGKYSMTYIDPQICSMWGFITINFTDNNKNKLQWIFSDMTDIIPPDCPYTNTTFPEPLPKNIILVKK